MEFTNDDIKQFVYHSCQLLDEEIFSDYLALFDVEKTRYRVTAYSPELRKDMVWLDHQREELEIMLKMIPEHIRMPGRFFRHATVYSVERKEDTANVVTSLLLFHIDQHGQLNPLSAARYHDQIRVGRDTLAIAFRDVRTDSRIFGAGIHVPI